MVIENCKKLLNVNFCQPGMIKKRGGDSMKDVNIDDFISKNHQKKLKKLAKELKKKGLTLAIVPPAPGQKEINQIEFEIVPIKQ